jgi:SRSO17 transposase
MSWSAETGEGIDDGGVTRADLDAWEAEFEDVCSRVDGLFSRPEPREHARHCLRGLVAPLERKNGWAIAEHAGEKEPKALQRLLNLTPWDAGELRDLVVGYAVEHFADSRGR